MAQHSSPKNAHPDKQRPQPAPLLKRFIDAVRQWRENRRAAQQGFRKFCKEHNIMIVCRDDEFFTHWRD
jgi:hypothetical protein